MNFQTMATKLVGARGMTVINHINRTLANNRKNLETHNQWVNKNLGIESIPLGEESEMMVLGDHTTNITNTTPPPNPSKLPSLLKLGAGIALAATGVGTGAGIYTAIPALIDLLKPPVVAPVEPKDETPVEEKWLGIELDKG